jgi:Tol biopolymer transport system component/DNA-binding winged helix-turn-helix (wHTH) protein
MNEHFVLRTREPAIDLGAQPDFPLGPLGVTPSTCEVTGADQTWRLEPRVMQVLVALWRAQGRVVSRAELVSSCWNDRIVGDDALNRCIARLRRLFEAADAPVSIITIARIGYRLEVEAPAAPSAEAEPAAARKPRRGVWIAAAVVLMLALAALGWWALQRPAGWTAEGFRPFAAETLIERHPAFSPDGRSLAYAVGADVGRRRIAVRELTGGPVTQVSDGPGDDYAPAWSPSGARLAFARFQPGQPCQILMRRLPAGPADVVGRCDRAERTKLAWSRSGEAIYFTDGPASATRVRVLDLATGRMQDLTRPDTRAGAYDVEPALSPNGRRLAFLRGDAGGRSRILSLDIAGGKITEIPSSGVDAASVAWTPDGRSLVASSDRAGDFSLWLLRADGRGQPRLLLTGLRAIGRVAVSPQGQIAMEMDSARINLARLGGAEISPANSSDWSPDFAPDGSVAFISNRGGAKAVWVMRPGQSAYQLPGPQLEHVYGVRWSPDGQRLAFSASRDGVSGLYVAGPDGVGLTRLNASASDFGAPAWTMDARAVIAPARDGSGWRLVRAPLDARQPAQAISGHGWVSVRNGPEGMFGVRADQAGIWRIGAGDQRTLMAPAVSAAQPEDWALAGGKLYVMERTKSPRFDADVMIYPASGAGPGQTAGHVSRVSEMPGLAVDPKSGAPVFPKIIFEDSDLGLMRLKRTP